MNKKETKSKNSGKSSLKPMIWVKKEKKKEEMMLSNLLNKRKKKERNKKNNIFCIYQKEILRLEKQQWKQGIKQVEML